MLAVRCCAAVCALGVASAAQAVVEFSFADPIPGRQLHNVQNGAGPGLGHLTYDASAIITFLMDGTSEGVGTNEWTNTRMELDMVLGTAVVQGGVTLAPVAGFFTIYDFTGNVRTDILTGESQNGAYVRIGATNSLLFSTPDGFTYTSGPALQSILGPTRILTALQEAVFTITNIVVDGGGSIIDPNGHFRSFSANTSFSGNSEVGLIPTPGSASLLALGVLALRRRRK